MCPLIEESEALRLQTAQETFETLPRRCPSCVGLVHGAQAEEKAATWPQFSAGELDLLVATTVIGSASTCPTPA